MHTIIEKAKIYIAEMKDIAARLQIRIAELEKQQEAIYSFKNLISAFETEAENILKSLRERSMTGQEYYSLEGKAQGYKEAAAELKKLMEGLE